MGRKPFKSAALCPVDAASLPRGMELTPMVRAHDPVSKNRVDYLRSMNSKDLVSMKLEAVHQSA